MNYGALIETARESGIWVIALVMAGLGAAQNMQWDSRPHRIANIIALLAVLAAALKNSPFVKAAPNA